jgi:hypothetical protein
MTFKPEQEPNDEERDEDRLMVLLALSSQELPEHKASTTQPEAMSSAELHAHLDADPAAFEEFLRQHRTAGAALRAKQSASWLDALRGWLAPLPRQAVAFGIAAVCASIVAFVLIENRPTRSTDVERSYQELLASLDTDALAALATASYRDEPRLGFTPRRELTTAAEQSFAGGIAAGRARLATAAATKSEPVANEAFFLLGQWNILLWAACESQQSFTADFWQGQRSRLQTVADELSRDPFFDPTLAAHLRRVDASLAQLSQNYSRRTAFELGEDLRLYRDQWSR